MKQKYHVGIDLGTTFSSLAYVDDTGHVEPFRLPDGNFQMASAVYFKSPSEIIVGSEALNFAVVDAARVARAFKRQMGEEEYAAKGLDGESLPFAPDDTRYRPEELSAMVLRRLLDAAAPTLGPIESAVISVPFVFDEKRRRATQDAGRIAGLKHVEIIDEPVAAAIAYGDMLIKQGQFDALGDVFLDETVLVYDLGGGTFDLTLMKMRHDGTFEVLITDGDERLGGEDWDELMLGMLAERYQSWAGKDPRPDKELMQELRLKAVAAKETLSSARQVEVVLTHHGRDLTFTITRADFAHKTKHLVLRTEETLRQMLERLDEKRLAELPEEVRNEDNYERFSWRDIDRPLMVGGASRMPMILSMMERCLEGRALDRSLSPDTAIAMGAALFAAKLGGVSGIPEIETVNSHALGLMVKSIRTGEVFNDVLIPANEKTGTKVTRSYRAHEKMYALVLAVLQGQSRNPDDCICIGEGGVEKLPPGLTTDDRIHVTFSFQQNGMLQVEARVRRADGKTVPVNFGIQVEGKMTEGEVDAALTTLKGFSIEA
jgi:molecular chaperone DnaK